MSRFAQPQSSIWFALLFQGLSGLIQVKGYIGLAGADYLAYQAAFVTGAVAATLVVLNLENAILGGGAGRSATLACRAFQVAGLASCLYDAASGLAVPNVVSFCCWFACTRLFLAMAANQPANFLLAGSLGVLNAAAAFVVSLPWLLAGAFAASLVAGWTTQQRFLAKPDTGMWSVLRKSALSYGKYLPHTVAGLFVGYFDRYLALHFVDGPTAERYLRAVQLCSMAAFLIYPFVYQERNRLIRAGSVGGLKSIAWIAAKTVVVLAAALALVAGGMDLAGSEARIAEWLMLVTFFGIVWAQLYQIVSPLNFVKERFRLMNSITSGTALVAFAVACVALSVSRSGLALASVLFAAWFCLFAATSWSLLGRQIQSMQMPDKTGKGL